VRTVLLTTAETNESFQRRMDLLARQLLSFERIASVSMDMDRLAGAIVKCTLTIVEAPPPTPIGPDARLAGGRFSGRGARGGRN
jgi:hypothetical protein